MAELAGEGCVWGEAPSEVRSWSSSMAVTCVRLLAWLDVGLRSSDAARLDLGFLQSKGSSKVMTGTLLRYNTPIYCIRELVVTINICR